MPRTTKLVLSAAIAGAAGMLLYSYLSSGTMDTNNQPVVSPTSSPPSSAMLRTVRAEEKLTSSGLPPAAQTKDSVQQGLARYHQLINSSDAPTLDFLVEKGSTERDGAAFYVSKSMLGICISVSGQLDFPAANEALERFRRRCAVSRTHSEVIAQLNANAAYMDSSVFARKLKLYSQSSERNYAEDISIARSTGSPEVLVDVLTSIPSVQFAKITAPFGVPAPTEGMYVMDEFIRNAAMQSWLCRRTDSCTSDAAIARLCGSFGSIGICGPDVAAALRNGILGEGSDQKLRGFAAAMPLPYRRARWSETEAMLERMMGR